MLDLDKYINDRLEIKILGNTISVKEPSVKTYIELQDIEKDLTKENYPEKTLQTAALFLNNNDSGLAFTRDQLSEVPMVVLEKINSAVVDMKTRVDADPNLNSPSPKGK